MERDRLASRLAWVTGLRLGFLSLLLGATAFIYLRGALTHYPQSQTIVLVSIGAAFALTALYATLLRRGKRLQRLAEAQIVLDQLTWTAIVYVTGGATSGATTFYGLTCLVAAVLIGLRGAAIAAVVGIGAFGLLCVAFGFGWVLPPADQRGGNYIVEWEAIFYPLAVNALGIVVVALLSGYLADRLRRTGGALQEATERAEAAERLAMLGRLAAGLAHEIRNPLGSISGSIEMLREAPGLGEDDRRLCEIVQREAGRLNQLVTDMMDLARPRKPDPAEVDVAELARDVVALAARSERSGAGDVTVIYDGPAEPVLATCDAAQMRQVLWNLVRNGVQATGAGTTVTVSVQRDGEKIRMSVADEGPGIEPGSERLIFDAFFTTRAHGAGLGLALVRRIIDDHAHLGASIEVRSGAAKGATFEVVLAPTGSATKRSATRGSLPASERSATPSAKPRVSSG
ncbi:MAG: two-component sensor histidine kinase [Labilithrix sp.]|nr:two-component sensor histidine kinase [Labilithrix sp.]MCW5815640.1 two-component sensor histidine kinase [Labilithrix sp.]